MKYDDNNHWTICGEKCSVKLNPEAHTFGKGNVTKEATKLTAGKIKFECTKCGFSKVESIPKLSSSHTHEYTLTVTEATCSSGGYTTHTCSCGHSWTDEQTSPVKHDFKYKFTKSEHWQECSYCSQTTDKASHKLGEWITTLKPGYTFNGEKERICKACGYSEQETIAKLTVPEDKFVVTIPDFDKLVPSVSAPSDSKTESDTSASSGSLGSKPDSKPSDTSSSSSSSSSAGSASSTGKKPTAGSSDTEVPEIKELLTKGEENTVPALPQLEPTEDGNMFEGWKDKTTGQTVSKGDKITANVEIVPVWKDCGEDKHTDKNSDNRCDSCGYILVKETVEAEPEKPDETVNPGESPETAGNEQACIPDSNENSNSNSDNNADNESDNTENSSSAFTIPLAVIIALAIFGVVVIVCVIAVIVSKKKK